MSMSKRALDTQNEQKQRETVNKRENCPDCRFDWDSRIWELCAHHAAEEIEDEREAQFYLWGIR